MKNTLLVLLVFIMFGCDAETLGTLGRELTRDKNYQVGLCPLCDNNSGIIWYCISESDFNYLKGLPKSCDVISITSLTGNKYSGVLNSNGLVRNESPCKN